MRLQSLNQIPPRGKAILIHVAGAPLLHRDLEYSLFSAVMHLFTFYIWHDLSSSNHFSGGHSLRYFTARSLRPGESKAASVHPALWRFVVILSRLDKYNSFITYTFLTRHNSIFASQSQQASVFCAFCSSLHEEALTPRWFPELNLLLFVLSICRGRLMWKDWDSYGKPELHVYLCSCGVLKVWGRALVSCVYGKVLITEQKYQS